MIFIILHCEDEIDFWYDDNQRRICADRPEYHDYGEKHIYVYLRVKRSI